MCTIVGGNCINMRLLITSILLFVYLNINGQGTDIVIQDGAGFKEQYAVLKQNPKIRHGTYIKYRQVIGDRVLVYEFGNYLNGMKHGNWEKFFEIFPHGTWNATQEIGNYFEGRKNGVWSSFYLDSTSTLINAKNLSSLLQAKTVFNNDDPKNTRLRLVGMYLNDKRVGEWMAFDYYGSLLQKYDFSKSRLLFEKSIIDSTQYNSNRKPLFIGGQSHLMKLLYSNYNSKEVNLKIIKKDSTYAIITFNINEQGKTGNIFIETNLNNKFFK